MALSPKRFGALAGLAVPILAMAGLFAWAGSTSALSAQGGDDPIGISRLFINDLNSGNCQGAIALIGSSSIHAQKPSCSGFVANSVTFSGCSYKLASLPKSLATGKVAGYQSLQAVTSSCTAKSNASGALDLPLQLLVITGMQSSTGSFRILDVEELNG